MTTSQSQGLILRCDPEGNVIAVLHQHLDGELPAEGRPFAALIARNGLAKALSFLSQLRSRNAVFGCELPLATAEQTVLTFGGLKLDDTLIIGGVATPDGFLAFCEDMMAMSNEQINALRSLSKAQSLVSGAPRSSDALYGRFSQLNSDLVTAQRDLAKKNYELQRLNDLKDQFLGLAAHDLRSPLGAIMVYSEFLLDDETSLSPQQCEFLDVIYSSSQFMLHMVDDLLDIATIQAGKLVLNRESVDLAALAAQHVSRNSVLAAKKEIAVAFEYDGGPLWAMVDGPKVEQVLYNLLSNAVKYSYPHSTIHVRLSCRDDQAIIAVQDEGQGIPEAEQNKLFRAFGRTSVQPTGDERSTGLGLAIVQNIVRGHGGHITVESTVGHGTTFTVTLPLAGEPAADVDAPVEEDARVATPAGRRALVADDDPLSRQMAVHLLEHQGYDVRAVSSGRQAVAAAREERFDLILTDHHMPDMEGTEATAAIRTDERGSGRHVPIIGMSSTGLPDDMDAGLAAGMDAYLIKPLDTTRLARTVARLATTDGASTAFDLDAALELVDGDREFLQELAELFLQQTPSTVAAMHQAVTLADAATLERLAHRLKSSAISLRAHGVHAVAGRLESMAAEDRLTEAAAILDQLHQELRTLEKALEPVLRPADPA